MAEALSLPPAVEPPRGESLKNKVVLLTGAAQGIGEAIVASFVSQQAKMVISDIQAEKVEKVAAHWREQGGDVQAIKADVSRQADLHAMVALAMELHGRVDVLVNCAGVNVFRDPLEMTEDDWRRCFAIDLDGAWYGCKAVLPQMIEQGVGSIINIASTHSSHIIPGCFPYPVAKHGLLGLTRALGIEYAPKGIRVNAIAPGFITSDMTNALGDKIREAVIGEIPLARFGEPADIAHAALFLASAMSGYVTGEVLRVDGGMAM